MRAGEIRALADRAGVASGVSVLDLCCGVAGPGRFITEELGCTYLGIDSSSSALEIARERSGELPCRFEVARIPPLPPGPFDVVLLFETMLAFPEKETLLKEIAGALATGGRFAFTMEEGLPLTEAEREAMPDADTVWLTPLDEMLACLERVGLVVRWMDDCSRSHRAVADSLIDAFAADAADIAAQIGDQALEELLTAHRLWSDWLRGERVRKLAFVAEKTETPNALSTSSSDARTGRRVDYRVEETAAGITAATTTASTTNVPPSPIPVALSAPIRTAPVAVPASKAPFHTALATGRSLEVVRANE